MSFLRRGNRRGRKASVILATVGTLLGFQALAAVPAFAVVTCSFAGGVITVNTDPNDTVTVQQNTTTGTILVNGADCTPVAPIATTTSIVINGDTGDEFVQLFMYDNTGSTIDWGAVNWSINLGSDATDDTLFIDNSGGDDAVTITAGASGIDLDTDADLDVTHAGTELFFFFGGPEDDTISAAGDATTGAAFASTVLLLGFGGDDTLMGGAGNDSGANGGIFGNADDDTVSGGLGDDTLDCDGGIDDTVDFSASATAVNVNLTTTNATGEGLDTVVGCEHIVGTALVDTLTGDASSNIITPGASDDKLDGAGGFDYADYGDATAAVTVDLAANTATGGSGNDTLTSIEGAFGSDFDDTFVDQTNQDNEYFGDSGSDTFDQGAEVATGDADLIDGEGGLDTVDYGLRTDGLQIDLDEDDDATDGTCNDDSGDVDDGEDDFLDNVENAVGGTGDDVICGSAFGNIVNPNGGQNVLEGNGGSDTLDYSSSTAGVEVNMAGGATAGDSALEFENVKGSDFADRITGDGLSNNIRGRGGNDNIRAGGGDDNVRGGAGNDILRLGAGDDDAFGGKGNDTIRGGPGTDFCKGGPGSDSVRGCELGRA